ncbi:MAG: hypothetical protein ABGW69_03085 [Nanoarchaeota archaeon]
MREFVQALIAYKNNIYLLDITKINEGFEVRMKKLNNDLTPIFDEITKTKTGKKIAELIFDCLTYDARIEDIDQLDAKKFLIDVINKVKETCKIKDDEIIVLFSDEKFTKDEILEFIKVNKK